MRESIKILFPLLKSGEGTKEAYREYQSALRQFNKNLKELEDLPALQLKILETQASYVRPGGTLLYSTCTVLKRENEDVVSAFLAAHGEFATEPLPLPEVFPKNETGMLTLIPGEYDTDGFFICRLRRKA